MREAHAARGSDSSTCAASAAVRHHDGILVDRMVLFGGGHAQASMHNLRKEEFAAQVVFIEFVTCGCVK